MGSSGIVALVSVVSAITSRKKTFTPNVQLTNKLTSRPHIQENIAYKRPQSQGEMHNNMSEAMRARKLIFPPRWIL